MAARLPVGKVLLGAFLVPWWNRRAFVRALALPFVLIALFSFAWYLAERLPQYYLMPWWWLKWPRYVLQAALFAMFAVTAHRLVLLDPATVAPGWSWRETRFLGWLLLIYAVFAGVDHAVTFPLVDLPAAMGREPAVSRAMLGWLTFIGFILALYVFARLAPLLPATAIDRRTGPRWAWRLTQSNGWRLVVIIGLVPLLFAVVAGLLVRRYPTPPEKVVLVLLSTMLFAIEVAALSLAYRELTRDETP